MPRPARGVALASFAVALLLFALLGVVPFVTKKRDQPASVPNPPPLSVVSLDVVRPGSTLCMAGVAVDPHGQVARMRIGTFGKPGPRLQLSLSGPGYRSRASEAGGYADNLLHSFTIAPPRKPQLAHVCLANRGRSKIALYAAADSARSRAAVTIDGRSVTATPTLGFYEARPVSIADRMSLSVDRIATFRGPFSHVWMIWLLLALFAIGVPLGIGAALWSGWR
jgi:hypothetical protein